MKILIAGIGNIFYCDDGFGCAAARELLRKQFPDGVTVRDFGIRSYDLAYTLTDDFDVAILVDALPRGEEPGTVFLMEPDLDRLGELESCMANAHAMNPVAVLKMARSLGRFPEKLFIIGCEPEILDGENEDGEIDLSRKVRRAIPDAVKMAEWLVEDLSETKQEQEIVGLVPA